VVHAREVVADDPILDAGSLALLLGDGRFVERRRQRDEAVAEVVGPPQDAPETLEQFRSERARRLTGCRLHLQQRLDELSLDAGRHVDERSRVGQPPLVVDYPVLDLDAPPYRFWLVY
jgi:hypothetical protein